jgi:two-component system, NarL family, invasion response regulator UvrY
VVIVDINMLGRNTIDILRLLKLEKPELPILILTMHPENPYAVRALGRAPGILTKSSAQDHLILAIHTVVEGRGYVSPALAP